jgi:hypothetical protein
MWWVKFYTPVGVYAFSFKTEEEAIKSIGDSGNSDMPYTYTDPNGKRTTILPPNVILNSVMILENN